MKQKFTAEIKRHENMDAAYVEIPFDVEAIFGAKRVKIKAWFDGEEYRGSIVRMGGCYLIGMPKALRRKVGKQPGDIVDVEVEKDEEERTVELPYDFLAALAENPDARGNFDKLSYSQRRKYSLWITGAKRAETRASRIEKAIELLKENQKLLQVTHCDLS